MVTYSLTLSSPDSLCMSWLMGIWVCGWHCGPDCWLGGSDELRFFSDSSLDLNGTMASWLMLGMVASSSKDATLPWSANSITAWTPWRISSVHTMLHQNESQHEVKFAPYVGKTKLDNYVHSFHKRSTCWFHHVWPNTSETSFGWIWKGSWWEQISRPVLISLPGLHAKICGHQPFHLTTKKQNISPTFYDWSEENICHCLSLCS